MLDPSLTLTVTFVGLTVLVAGQDIYALGRATPVASRRRWLGRGVVVALAWMGLHFAVAASGILEGDSMPPKPLFYLVFNVGAALALVFSPVGRRLASLPLWLLVASQVFRLPLEIWLHVLHDAGQLPIQMTWSGRNQDVWTAVLALVVAPLVWRRPKMRGLVWGWNIVGFGLLLNVVSIAVRSMPGPLRAFHNEPAVLLPFVPPFNWIVGVHVFTALVGHLIVFRALLGHGAEDASEEAV